MKFPSYNNNNNKATKYEQVCNYPANLSQVDFAACTHTEAISAVFFTSKLEKRDVQVTKPSIFSTGIVKGAYQNVKRGRFIDL